MVESIVELGAVLEAALGNRKPVGRTVPAPSDLAKQKVRTISFLSALSLVGGNTALASALVCSRVHNSRLEKGRLVWPPNYGYEALMHDFSALQTALARFNGDCKRNLQSTTIGDSLATELSRLVKEWKAISSKSSGKKSQPSASRA